MGAFLSCLLERDMRGDEPETQNQELEAPKTSNYPKDSEVLGVRKTVPEWEEQQLQRTDPEARNRVVFKTQGGEEIKVVPGEPEWQRFEMVEKQN
jgi:hypothetical protein